MNTRALLFVAVLFYGCKAAETPEQIAAREQAAADSAKAAVADGTARWVRFVNAGQPDSVASLFTADGVMMPPDVPGATGHDSITARNRTLIIPGGTLSITGQNTSVHGPIAVERGVWSYTAPAQGRTPAINLGGKYLAHWHKTDAGWLIAENIWNNDSPAPPMPPAR
jgi:ketosteroid isomerase-like protein